MLDLQSIGRILRPETWVMDVWFSWWNWLAFVILGVAYFNMGAEYEHLKKSSEALWHYQRVYFSDVSAAVSSCKLQWFLCLGNFLTPRLVTAVCRSWGKSADLGPQIPPTFLEAKQFTNPIEHVGLPFLLPIWGIPSASKSKLVWINSHRGQDQLTKSFRLMCESHCVLMGPKTFQVEAEGEANLSVSQVVPYAADTEISEGTNRCYLWNFWNWWHQLHR